MNPLLLAFGFIFVLLGTGGSLKVGIHGLTIGGSIGGTLIVLGAVI